MADGEIDEARQEALPEYTTGTDTSELDFSEPEDTDSTFGRAMHQLRDEVRDLRQLHPASVTIQLLPGAAGRGVQHVASGLKHSFEGLVTDYKDADRTERVKSAASAVGFVTVTAVDRTRRAFVYVPIIATEVYENTGSSVKAAVAGTLACYIINFLVGEGTQQGIKHHPRATKAVAESFPSVVSFFDNAIPGLEKTPKDPNQSLLSRVKSRIGEHVPRGGFAFSQGVSAYVGTNSIKGRSQREIRWSNILANNDMSGYVFPLIMLGTKGVEEIGKRGHPELAQDISEWISNSANWQKVAAALILYSLASNHYKNKQSREEDENSDENYISTL